MGTLGMRGLVGKIESGRGSCKSTPGGILEVIMTVEKYEYDEILRDLVLGNPVAEFDSSLDDARVETPTFEGVFNDEFDIVTGRKGAGKTAIFRLISHELSQYFLIQRRTVILSGVNPSGESIFNQFISDFKTFDEIDFENFWKLYTITLIYNQFINNKAYETYLAECGDEITQFKRACSAAGIPDIKAGMSRKEMVQWVLSVFKRINFKGSVASDANNPTLFMFAGELSITPETKKEKREKTSLYVEEIGEAIKHILEKSNLKVWIVLDRLDEVFERFSMVEFNGLRGLLRTYKSFELSGKSDYLKIKIFLRDDIKDFLTNAKIFNEHYPKKTMSPLPAATHIFAKESPVLTWTKEEIEQLILLRLLISKKLKKHLGISVDLDRHQVSALVSSPEDRKKYWNMIFPTKMANLTSLDWIFTRLKDSNGVVTPRSIIDMLNGAKDYQKKNMITNFQDATDIFPQEAIKAGIEVASKNKLELDILSEFPLLQPKIKALGAYGHYKLSKLDLMTLYQEDYEKVAESLRRIGVLRYVQSSQEYRIEFVYRPALKIAYRY